ncbi:MAG: DHH family phosphoesterase [Planctomycetes bacterium]|nr:DHH family phosphoesterase [Planctomycetota bacterium]
MSQIQSSKFIEAAETMAAWRRPLLFSHAKPDGDALGSLIAMHRFLASPGVEPMIVLFDDVPGRYSFLERLAPCRRLGKDIQWDGLTDADAVILLDTCSYSQLEPVADWLRSTSLTKLVVDHHATGDDLADVLLTDASAASTSLILFEWARSVGWSLDTGTAVALYVGLATDTGWFRHSNTDARALEAAADLTRQGARAYELFDALYQQESVARFRLRAEACKRLELRLGERLAVITIPMSAFDETGAVRADTEDLVNEPLRLASVVVSIMLVEDAGGIIRVGFRSRAPSDPQATACAKIPDVDVAAIAQSFGGGGHRRAAGARVTGTLEQVKEKIIARIEPTLTDP